VNDQRHKREYPEGPRRELTDEWRDRVKRKLAENAAKIPPIEPTNAAELARALGADKAGIGRMLLPSSNPKAQQTSAWVDAVCDILGIPSPTVAITPDDEEAFSLIAQLGPREKSAVLDLVRKLAASPSKKRNR
jgi:hypothetical protein